ncbi:hypothetical protein GF358_04395 [Candidatus Woesearchaeota archaeon]|nr:hypothetical protein [Candidatus Woesearchaeota archaeon]
MSYSNPGCRYGKCSGSGYFGSMNTRYSDSLYENTAKYQLSDLEKTAKYTTTHASISAQESHPQYMHLKGNYKLHSREPEELFLNPNRPVTEIVTNEDKIIPYVKETFEKTTGKTFPKNLKVVILNEKAFDEVHQGHKGVHSQFVKGFAINRNGKGLNEIFVKQNHIDSLMITIGHEIGHVMSYTLPDERDEEAKAFAFSMAWMKTIKENNIAGISSSINPRPAKNGIHDVAFEFVLEESEKGVSAMEIFKKICKGELSIQNKLELVLIE